MMKRLLIVLMIVLASHAPLFGQIIPEIKKNCNICHLPHDTSGKLLNAPLTELCLDCHSERRSPAEHKVDILPQMPVGNLPLYEGKITCITCHDPHGKGGFPSMLRERPRLICTKCHKK